MRCPKCGFISFDHMETCLKCKKAISGSTEVEGTTYHAAAPSFLRVPEKDALEPESSSSATSSFDKDDEYDFTDPELDMLVEDDEEEMITFGGAESEDFLLEDDEESDEGGDFEFDLDSDDLEFSEEEQATSPALNVPDELADISDLAPPAVVEIPSPSDEEETSFSLDDEMNLDEDLDLEDLDLDLDLGLGGDGDATEAELSLSLDDIELSAGDITEESSDLDSISMDLDLDDLDKSPEPEKEKSSGSLDGISLSLD